MNGAFRRRCRLIISLLVLIQQFVDLLLLLKQIASFTTDEPTASRYSLSCAQRQTARLARSQIRMPRAGRNEATSLPAPTASCSEPLLMLNSSQFQPTACWGPVCEQQESTDAGSGTVSVTKLRGGARQSVFAREEGGALKEEAAWRRAPVSSASSRRSSPPSRGSGSR